MKEQKMNWARLRLVVLIILLILALFYRFPVEIQKFTIETKAFISKIIRQVKERDSPKPLIESDEFETDTANIVIITLKNKGRIVGIIKDSQQPEEKLLIDIGFGNIEIMKSNIETIRTASTKEKEEILKEWRGIGSNGTEKVAVIRYWNKNRIIVKAVLNDKVKTILILDTGAPYMAITPKIGKQLFDLQKTISKKVDMQWTDGSTTPGKLVLLESVTVGNVKVGNIKAVIAEIPVLDLGTDGLLGMSFLNNFHVKIDGESRKLILEKK